MTVINYKLLTQAERVALARIYKSKPNLGLLNVGLMQRQNLSLEDVKAVKSAHKAKDKLFAKMEIETDSVKLKKYVKKLRDIEFAMQKAWKFDENEAFHSWWFQAPHCTCPKMDNQERVGHSRIINESCPLHGK